MVFCSNLCPPFKSTAKIDTKDDDHDNVVDDDDKDDDEGEIDNKDSNEDVDYNGDVMLMRVTLQLVHLTQFCH